MAQLHCDSMAHLHCDSTHHCRAELIPGVANTFFHVQVSQKCEDSCSYRRRSRALSDVCPHEWDGLDGGVEHPCVCNERAMDWNGKALNNLSAFRDTACGQDCSTAACSEASGHSHASEDVEHGHSGHGDRGCHGCSGCDHCGRDDHEEHHGHGHSHGGRGHGDPGHGSDALGAVAPPAAPPAERKTLDVHVVARQTFVDVELQVKNGCVRRACPQQRRGRSFSDPCPPIPSPLDNEARPCTCNDRGDDLGEDCDLPGHDLVESAETRPCRSDGGVAGLQGVFLPGHGEDPTIEAVETKSASLAVPHAAAAAELPSTEEGSSSSAGGSSPGSPPGALAGAPPGMLVSRPPGNFPPGCFQMPPGLLAAAPRKEESRKQLDRRERRADEEARSAAFDEPGNRTTVILKNLPPGCSRAELLRVLDTEGFRGEYDFVYLPVSITTGGSYGYAFANFLTPASAGRAARQLHGFERWKSGLGNNTLRTLWSEIQGREAYVEKYRNSPVMHRKVPDEYRPVLLADGKVVPFPEPTRAIKAPRFRDRH